MYNNNKLLMEFSNVSDEVLKVELNKIIHEYSKSKKIEKIILEIIYDLGYSKKLPINHELDNRFKKITKVSELRKIDQPKKMGKIIITKEDIIKALYEIKEREAKWIDEHSYLYDVYYDGLENEYTDYKSKKVSTEVKEEINAFYDMVINSLEPSKKKSLSRR